MPHSRFGADGDDSLQVLWEDGERVFCRTWRGAGDGDRRAVMAVLPAAEQPSPGSVDRLTREYALKDYLDDAWAVRPVELVRERGQIMLVLEPIAGEPLNRFIGTTIEIGAFLRLATALAAALGRLHAQGLVHKDIKPANILVDSAMERVWLTGFGIASRLPREHQPPAPPEFIAGTLPYMAPEQTGRMNRSIDQRSDLYSLGVTLYELLAGALPFSAADPVEWVHCHIARRPAPPGTRRHGIPDTVSQIILKLLAKTPEERYQTAAGLEHDLRRSLAAWEAEGAIAEFPLGERDRPDRLAIPEKLYGREREVGILLASFDRVVATGTPELVLVSGDPGIGKSSLVNELHKGLVLPRGLFATGKFDQRKRDVPCATLAQAFQSLIRSLLGKSEAELAPWRQALHEALGANGALIVDLVPELKLLIGEQPPAPDLPAQDAQRRFQRLLRRFIGVFARPEHPLVLFLDDLQWLDAATLDLLEDLLREPEMRHLLLIGAYRDNEVTAAHPLIAKLGVIRDTRAPIHDIVLAPLAARDVARLLADALFCEPERALPLAQLVCEKTAGNSFFAIQFISELAEEGLLTFDHGEAAWRWDLARIRAKNFTDNVVDLMVAKLRRLPEEGQVALQRLACLGNSAEIATLAVVQERSEDRLDADLWEPVRQGFVLRDDTVYRFAHDRIQEAAYSLIPEERRADTHLRIGRLLLARTPIEGREEAIFDIVNHLNRGAALIAARAERVALAELNLIAGKRAKNAAAYGSALTYFVAGEAHLPDDRWQRHYRLAFSLALGRAECEYLSGDAAAARERLEALSGLADNIGDQAAVACLQIDLHTNSDRADRAVDVGLDFLARAGTSWTVRPTDADVAQEIARIWQQLGDRPIEQLVELPRMTDPACAAVLDVLTAVHAPANFTDGNLLALVIARIVNLSIEHGNGEGSPLGYVYLGMILESRLADYDAGFRFGQAGVDLVEREGNGRFKAYAYLNFGNAVNPWSRHVRTSLALLRTALAVATRAGHLTVAAYTYTQLISAHLVAGDPLADVLRFAESALAFMRQIAFGTGINLTLAHLGFIRALRGMTAGLASFEQGELGEEAFAQRLDTDPGLGMSACWYWIRKLQSCVLAADFGSALAAAVKAEGLLWTSPGFLIIADYHFHAALARASCCGSAEGRKTHELRRQLAAHEKQIEAWARTCPENFSDRLFLVSAEIARIEGRHLEAMPLYEKAIRAAHENGFVQNEAIASELAGRFYLGLGLETNGYAHLRNAHACFALWGAEGKVRQLEAQYPRLSATEMHLGTQTMDTGVHKLDVATVVKASQAVTTEIELPKLIERLMKVALENAGADRGVLIFPRQGDYRIAAVAEVRGDDIVLRQVSLAGETVPDSLIRYVSRTQESVILDDAGKSNPFAEDDYFSRRSARSVFCLPLVRQTVLAGVLFLENSLTSHAFTSERTTLLELLASQLAISLENTRLYSELREREAKFRRLVDANIIGIFIFDFEGRIIEANDAFLRMVGYDRGDFASGRIYWMDLTPPEWRDRHARAWAELRSAGTVQPYEREYFRKDGSRVPALIGSAQLEERGNEGVAFVLDLSERERANEALREVQMELAHANRVATMGQLTASIAHEVSQPITAALANAQAGLRWLRARSPDLGEVQQSLDRIVRDTSRAGEVIGRIRGLIKKDLPRQDSVDMNEAIREVIELTRSEAVKTGVTLKLDLAGGLPLVEGDRVQLQQVVLNLVVNAVQAMGAVPDGGRDLLVATAPAEPYGVLVTVKDSGPGFASGSVERIFDPFYSTKSGGLGMGLSICQSIVTAHHGRIWAAANQPRGTIFHFTVPAHRGGDR